MKYYKTNAVYTNLQAQPDPALVWTSGHAWMLVYGDQHAVPKALVLAFGDSWAVRPQVTRTIERIAAKSGLPLMLVKFDDAAASIDEVAFGPSLRGLATRSLDDLKREFEKLGLPVTQGACSKAVNDAESSAYHAWQRENLGAITVTDIDLVRLSGAGEPVEALELKRSYIPLGGWKPFPQDYTNFNLLLALCQRAGMELHIAYNVRHKTPTFHDDVSEFAMFAYAIPNSPDARGRFKYQDVVVRKY